MSLSDVEQIDLLPLQKRIALRNVASEYFFEQLDHFDKHANIGCELCLSINNIVQKHLDLMMEIGSINIG